MLHPGKELGVDHTDGCGNNAAEVEAVTKRNSDGRRDPHAGSGGQARDGIVVPDQNNAGAEEADAGNHLGRDTEHVAAHAADLGYEQTAEDGHNAAEADKNMRAEARRSAVLAPLVADQSTRDHSKQDPQ